MSRRDELIRAISDWQESDSGGDYYTLADRIESLFDEGEVVGWANVYSNSKGKPYHTFFYTTKELAEKNFDATPCRYETAYTVPIRLPSKSETEFESPVSGEVDTEGKDASEWLQTLARIYPFDHQFTATPNWCHAVRGTAKWAIGEIERLRLHVHALSASNEKLIAKNEKLVGENVKLAERNNNQRFALGAERAGIDKINKEMGLLKEENEKLNSINEEFAAAYCPYIKFNGHGNKYCDIRQGKPLLPSSNRLEEIKVAEYKPNHHPDRNIRPSVCISAEALDRIYDRLDALELLNEAISRQICSPEPDARTLKLYETMDKQHKEQAAIEQRLDALEWKHKLVGPVTYRESEVK